MGKTGHKSGFWLQAVWAVAVWKRYNSTLNLTLMTVLYIRTIFPLIFSSSFPFPEFCKSATTATTLPTETMMDRAFGWVVAAHFFMQEKGLLPPLLSLFYPKTSGKGGRNRRKRTTRRKKETDTNTQKPETGPAMRSPLKDKTPDAA